MRKLSEWERIGGAVSVFLISLCVIAWGDPPLPTHQVEGNSGVFITPVAYLANPAGPNDILGLPSVAVSYADIGQKDFQAVTVTENLWGRIELGYAAERMGLGEWPDLVKQATGYRVDHDAVLHNFNTRAMILPEGAFGNSWVPAVTVGAHLKYQQDFDDINRQLSGTCDALGADHDTGVEFTAMATKTLSGVLPMPLIASAGLRNGDAVHTGFLGFAGERRTTVEGSLIYFLTEKLLIATEYRQKPDLIDECTAGGIDLVKSEDDWWDICLGYIVNDHITVAGGYANFGNVLNGREDNVWAAQVKFEF